VGAFENYLRSFFELFLIGGSFYSTTLASSLRTNLKTLKKASYDEYRISLVSVSSSIQIDGVKRELYIPKSSEKALVGSF
jgi:hypothetical protein